MINILVILLLINNSFYNRKNNTTKIIEEFIDDPKVYTITMNNEEFTWGSLMLNCHNSFLPYPWYQSTWALFYIVASSEFVKDLLTIIFYFFPGLFIDGILKLTNNEKRFFLFKFVKNKFNIK